MKNLIPTAASPKLTLGISTLNEGIYNLKLPCSNNSLVILISHQVTDGNIDKYINLHNQLTQERSDLTIVCSDNIGLSKSRNVVLNNCETDYLLISDDDVAYHEDFVEVILDSLSHMSGTLNVFKISSDDGDFKDYRMFKKTISKIKSAKISSIEMVINNPQLRQEKISFDEDFGLGAYYPSGEEMIMCCDILDNDGSIFFHDYSIAYHPRESSGKDFVSSKLKIEAKKEMFKRCFKSSWRFYLLAFFIKKLNYLLKRKKVFAALRIFFF